MSEENREFLNDVEPQNGIEPQERQKSPAAPVVPGAGAADVAAVSGMSEEAVAAGGEEGATGAGPAEEVPAPGTGAKVVELDWKPMKLPTPPAMVGKEMAAAAGESVTRPETAEEAAAGGEPAETLSEPEMDEKEPDLGGEPAEEAELGGESGEDAATPAEGTTAPSETFPAPGAEEAHEPAEDAPAPGRRHRRALGTALMSVGLLLVAAALALFLYNRWDSSRAGDTILFAVETIEEAEEPDVVTEEGESAFEIDGETYIGVLEIPALDLTLPVIGEWSYPSLKIAPCRYTGTAEDCDLVICAHNYDTHFGRLKNLAGGEEVSFTDADGNIYVYIVSFVETLQPTAVEEMTVSGYDLSLFTCTYGGATRVTARCQLIEILPAQEMD